MSKGTDNPWTEEQEAALAQEKLVAEILEIRRGKGESAASHWKTFIESKVLTALVTVLLGGVVVQWITSSFQERLQRQEQKLQAYRADLEAGRELVTAISIALGKIITPTENLLMRRPVSVDPKVQADHNDRADKRRFFFNDAVVEWIGRKGALELEIMFYYGDRPEVITSWRALESAMDELVDVGRESEILPSILEANVPGMADFHTVKASVRAAQTSLVKAIANARREGWQNVLTE